MPETFTTLISEKLLQFIWQFQYFNKNSLTTLQGEPLKILYQGALNANQGPDFLEAKIKIGETEWVGSVELHLLASQWIAHKHTADSNYKNVILHVVWISDVAIHNNAGNLLPALELQPLVSTLMLQQYEQLMHAQGFVPCENYLPVLSSIAWDSWKERLAIERLQKRSLIIQQFLKQSNNHWEEVFWWMLARNFGAAVNTEIFEAVARTITVNLLAKHKNQIHQLEALLLGQANLLNSGFDEDYPKLLQREFRFLKAKYNLNAVNIQPAFLRMRPANFPTIRLAQLAMLVHASNHLFSKIKEVKDVASLKEMFAVTANDYWHYHYRFDEAGEYHQKKIGAQMINNIIINTAVPVLFAYGLYTKENVLKEKAVDWLTQLGAEQNNITKNWTSKGVENSNALHSQSLIELKKYYCDAKLCLQCAVGNKLLRS